MLAVFGFNHAQITISGRVTDASDNTALAFVNITNNAKGTITDENGYYSIEVLAETSQLKFSFLGYKTQTITVGNQTVINVVLVEDASALDEVVITALGLERDTKELGYLV